jgi:hypothetical protein
MTPNRSTEASFPAIRGSGGTKRFKLQIKQIHYGMSGYECQAEYEKLRTLELTPSQWGTLGLTMALGRVPTDEDVQAAEQRAQRDREAMAGLSEEQRSELYGLALQHPYQTFIELCDAVREKRERHEARQKDYQGAIG